MQREREHDKATINVTSVQWIFPLFALSSQRIAFFRFLVQMLFRFSILFWLFLQVSPALDAPDSLFYDLDPAIDLVRFVPLPRGLCLDLAQ